MKKTITSIFFLSFFYLAHAQNPVPNSSFENWTTGVPNSWTDQNGGGSITQTSPGYAGSYAVKGTLIVTPSTYTPTLVSLPLTGFAVTQNYAYLRFYYKVNLAVSGGSSDKFIADVAIYNSSAGSAGYANPVQKIITVNASTYTAKQVPIIYTGTAAKATITFTVQPGNSDPYAHNGTWFIIDSVSLTNSALIGINEIEETSMLQIFPNPTHAYLNIKTDATKPMQIKLSDVVGRVLVNRISESPVNGYIQDTINTESLSSGLYFLMLSSDKKTILRRVIVD